MKEMRQYEIFVEKTARNVPELPVSIRQSLDQVYSEASLIDLYPTTFSSLSSTSSFTSSSTIPPTNLHNFHLFLPVFPPIIAFLLFF